MEPCSLSASYHMRKQLPETEEVVNVTASPVVIALSMEVVSTVLKPVIMAMNDSKTVSNFNRAQPPAT